MVRRYQIGRDPHRLMSNSTDGIDPKSEKAGKMTKELPVDSNRGLAGKRRELVTGKGYAHTWGRLAPPSSRPAATMAVTIPEYPVQRQI